MFDTEALVYFFGDWSRDDQTEIVGAAREVTPEEVRRAWNAKLGHLWVVLRHDDGRLSAQTGPDRVEGETVPILAARIREHTWNHAASAWASGRRNGRLRA